MLDNYPMAWRECYDRRFFMKENLLLAVPASFESNKAAQVWGMTSDDISRMSIASGSLRCGAETV